MSGKAMGNSLSKGSYIETQATLNTEISLRVDHLQNASIQTQMRRPFYRSSVLDRDQSK